MWIVRQAVSCLAVVAAAGLHVGAHAREVAAAVDVLRAAGESVYPIGGDASDGALPYMAEIGLQGGYDVCRSGHRVRRSSIRFRWMKSVRHIKPNR